MKKIHSLLFASFLATLSFVGCTNSKRLTSEEITQYLCQRWIYSTDSKIVNDSSTANTRLVHPAEAKPQAEFFRSGLVKFDTRSGQWLYDNSRRRLKITVNNNERFYKIDHLAEDKIILSGLEEAANTTIQLWKE